MAQALREQALDAQQDKLEIREMMQTLIAAFTAYARNPSTLQNDATFQLVVQEIEEVCLLTKLREIFNALE